MNTPYGYYSDDERLVTRWFVGIILLIATIAYCWLYFVTIPESKEARKKSISQKEIIVVGGTTFERKVVENCEYLRDDHRIENQWFHKANCTNSFHSVK